MKNKKRCIRRTSSGGPGEKGYSRTWPFPLLPQKDSAVEAERSTGQEDYSSHASWGIWQKRSLKKGIGFGIHPTGPGSH